jgi:hypothetical protein
MIRALAALVAERGRTPSPTTPGHTHNIDAEKISGCFATKRAINTRGINMPAKANAATTFRSAVKVRGRKSQSGARMKTITNPVTIENTTGIARIITYEYPIGAHFFNARPAISFR